MKCYFTSNPPFGGSGLCERMLKGLLLCMAVVLFQYTQVHAQVNTTSEQAIKTSDETPAHLMDNAHPETVLYANSPQSKSGFSLLSKNNPPIDTVANPDVPPNINCTDLRIALVLDESGSIKSVNGVEQVREATMALAQSLQGTPAQITVIEFGSYARTIDLGGTVVTQQYLDNLELFLYDEYLNQSYDPNSDGAYLPCPLLWTNWEDAFLSIIDLDPNLVLFLTDGVPSVYNVPDSVNSCGYIVNDLSAGLSAAIVQANVAKENGSHIFAIGVGNNIDVENIKLISGSNEFEPGGSIFTDDYTTGSFEELAESLTLGVNNICGTGISISKTVDFDQVCADETITFTITVENTGGSNDYDAVGVFVVDTFSTAFTNLAIVGAPVAGAEINGQMLSYDAGDIAINETATIQVQAKLTGPNGVYSNTAHATAVNANPVQDEVSVEKTDIVTSYLEVTACQSYLWHDFTYTESGMHIIEGTNGNGCPSIDSLDLTINLPAFGEETINACGSFEWNGEVYEEDGVYTHTFTGENGQCDSTATLHLTLSPAPSHEQYVTFCGGIYSDENGVYFNSGIYSTIIPGENGACDSTVTLHLTLNPQEGDACNDGDPNTVNDMVTADCGCEGTLSDPCENAIPLVCNAEPVTVSTAGSTAISPSDCPISEDNGLWFTFNGTGENIYIYASSPGISIGISVYSGTCDNLTVLQNCNQVIAGGVMDYLISNSIPGEQYLVYLSSYQEITADITVGISCQPNPVNDFCTDAISLQCGQTVEGYLFGGTTDPEAICATSVSAAGAGVWYSIEGINGTITATTCSEDGTTINSALGVFTGNCGELVCLTGNDDSPTGATDLDCTYGHTDLNLAATVIFEATEGTTYYILVTTEYGLHGGEFDLTVTCEEDEIECLADAGSIETESETTLCIDTEATVEVYFTSPANDEYTTLWAITDAGVDPILLDIFATQPIGGFGFDGYTGVDFNIWAINTNAPGTVLDDIAEAIANGLNPNLSDYEDLCWEVSNPIAITLETCVTDCEGIVNGDSHPGASCDDGNPNTANDVYNNNCECMGTPVVPGCYAEEVIEYSPGLTADSTSIHSIRTNPEKALGAPEDNDSYNFVSLGYGGSLTLRFGGSVFNGPGDDLEVIETTFNEEQCDVYEESADIYVSQDGTNWVFIGTTCQDGLFDISDGDASWTYINYIKIVDATSELSVSPDAYDVDGVRALNGCGIVYECPELNANIGDACDDQNPLTSNDLVTADCECTGTSLTIFDCPELEANIGDACGNGGIVTTNCECDDTTIPGCTAVEVLSFNQGPSATGAPIDSQRNDPSKALGEPQDDNTMNFVALGYGGELILAFGENVINGPGNDLEVVETTFNNTCEFYEESAEVFVSQYGVEWVSLGTTCQDGFFDISDGNASWTFINMIKIVDITSAGSPSPDAFDVDGVRALNGCLPEDPMGDVGGCDAECIMEFGYFEGTQLNGSPIDADRAIAEHALEVEGNDAPGGFVSLGYGGSIILCFDGAVLNQPGNDLEIIETSFGDPVCGTGSDEYADVEVSINGTDWFFVATICRDEAIDISDASEYLEFIRYVRVSNNDDLSNTPDGYDLDGVRVLSGPCQQIGLRAVVELSNAEKEEPVEFEAYPNPSSGESSVSFSVPVDDYTTVEVYTMEGKKVATLYQNLAKAGQQYKLDFDGSNLPNGIYLYKLTNSETSHIEKFLIAK